MEVVKNINESQHGSPKEGQSQAASQSKPSSQSTQQPSSQPTTNNQPKYNNESQHGSPKKNQAQAATQSKPSTQSTQQPSSQPSRQPSNKPSTQSSTISTSLPCLPSTTLLPSPSFSLPPLCSSIALPTPYPFSTCPVSIPPPFSRCSTVPGPLLPSSSKTPRHLSEYPSSKSLFQPAPSIPTFSHSLPCWLFRPSLQYPTTSVSPSAFISILSASQPAFSIPTTSLLNTPTTNMQTFQPPLCPVTSVPRSSPGRLSTTTLSYPVTTPIFGSTSIVQESSPGSISATTISPSCTVTIPSTSTSKPPSIVPQYSSGRLSTTTLSCSATTPIFGSTSIIRESSPGSISVTTQSPSCTVTIPSTSTSKPPSIVPQSSPGRFSTTTLSCPATTPIFGSTSIIQESSPGSISATTQSPSCTVTIPSTSTSKPPSTVPQSSPGRLSTTTLSCPVTVSTNSKFSSTSIVWQSFPESIYATSLSSSQPSLYPVTTPTTSALNSSTVIPQPSRSFSATIVPPSQTSFYPNINIPPPSNSSYNAQNFLPFYNPSYPPPSFSSSDLNMSRPNSPAPSHVHMRPQQFSLIRDKSTPHYFTPTNSWRHPEPKYGSPPQPMSVHPSYLLRHPPPAIPFNPNCILTGPQPSIHDEVQETDSTSSNVMRDKVTPEFEVRIPDPTLSFESVSEKELLLFATNQEYLPNPPKDRLPPGIPYIQRSAKAEEPVLQQEQHRNVQTSLPQKTEKLQTMSSGIKQQLILTSPSLPSKRPILKRTNSHIQEVPKVQGNSNQPSTTPPYYEEKQFRIPIPIHRPSVVAKENQFSLSTTVSVTAGQHPLRYRSTFTDLKVPAQSFKTHNLKSEKEPVQGPFQRLPAYDQKKIPIGESLPVHEHNKSSATPNDRKYKKDYQRKNMHLEKQSQAYIQEHKMLPLPKNTTKHVKKDCWKKPFNILQKQLSPQLVKGYEGQKNMAQPILGKPAKKHFHYQRKSPLSRIPEIPEVTSITEESFRDIRDTKPHPKIQERQQITKTTLKTLDLVIQRQENISEASSSEESIEDVRETNLLPKIQEKQENLPKALSSEESIEDVRETKPLAEIQESQHIPKSVTILKRSDFYHQHHLKILPIVDKVSIKDDTEDKQQISKISKQQRVPKCATNFRRSGLANQHQENFPASTIVEESIKDVREGKHLPKIQENRYFRKPVPILKRSNLIIPEQNNVPEALINERFSKRNSKAQQMLSLPSSLIRVMKKKSRWPDLGVQKLPPAEITPELVSKPVDPRTPLPENTTIKLDIGRDYSFRRLFAPNDATANPEAKATEVKFDDNVSLFTDNGPGLPPFPVLPFGAKMATVPPFPQPRPQDLPPYEPFPGSAPPQPPFHPPTSKAIVLPCLPFTGAVTLDRWPLSHKTEVTYTTPIAPVPECDTPVLTSKVVQLTGPNASCVKDNRTWYSFDIQDLPESDK